MSENEEPVIPQWEINNTHPNYWMDLEEGLSGILDPELGYSVLQLGLIRDIKLDENSAKVLMILTTPYCPYGPSLLEATRAKVERILGVPTTIEYGSHMWDPTLMDPDLREDEWGF